MTELLTNLQAWWDCQMMMATGMCDMCAGMMCC